MSRRVNAGATLNRLKLTKRTSAGMCHPRRLRNYSILLGLPRWLSASPVNTSAWITLVVSWLENQRCPTNSVTQDAELSSLEDSRDAFQLYDIAVR